MKKATAVSITASQQLNRFLYLAFMTLSIYLMMSMGAHASIVSAITNVVNQACGIVPGLGTLAIIVLGITAMFGRLTWSQALLIAVGIAIATGAAALFASIAGPGWLGVGSC